MSTSTDPTISDFAASVTFNYCSISIITLLTYYYLTTLSQELKYYNRKFSVATLLYITNRYVPLANALYAAPWLVYSGSEQYFPWAIFSALRTYALHRKLYSAIMVLVMSLSTVIISSLIAAGLELAAYQYGTHIGELLDSLRHSLHTYEGTSIAPAAARVPMVIADLITIVITWKTQHRTYSLGKKLPASFILTTVLLRDGTIYFVVLTILNILLLAFDYHQVFANDPINVSYLVNFAEPITSILISDFLTNLREAADNLASGPESQVSVDTLEFRIIGSIGASLPGPDEYRASSEAHGENNGQIPEAYEEDQNGELVILNAEAIGLRAMRGGADV
ncbi:hypothetical protein ONZ51_g2449 [Trametes cubensis]|uniref:DUF6533 domain-containing protein n=1 Tax=Trametes cubensis TaxID=1111947 RepID=A0AAD7XGQ1_9APHY|nr:hypothetical protein ONZ51_g2449 [Trametes cubensis]